MCHSSASAKSNPEETLHDTHQRQHELFYTCTLTIRLFAKYTATVECCHFFVWNFHSLNRKATEISWNTSTIQPMLAAAALLNFCGASFITASFNIFQCLCNKLVTGRVIDIFWSSYPTDSSISYLSGVCNHHTLNLTLSFIQRQVSR